MSSQGRRNMSPARVRRPSLASAATVLAVVVSACGAADGPSRQEVARGREIYAANCSICHGAEGQGKPRLGKDLRGNPFVSKISDAELLGFLIEGRPAFHPDNEQGIDMPPRGGNPGLTDRDLQAIAAFLRTL